MSIADYTKAQKLGEKKYQAAVAKDENPYLPVLDELVSQSDISGEVNLGLQHVSLDKVVGTATAGRTRAFASNFMPILEYKSEFGAKWASLSDSHVEEGIHDPIKAYEYMNKFYVIEGNKRVSVLKFFGADSVPAMVTRKVPKKTDDLENKIYYEFMDFHKQTRINYCWFTAEGGFDKLREYIGITPTDDFDEDMRKDFNSAHLFFEKAFLAKGGEKLSITCEDAMLVFMNVYSYEELKNMGREEVKECLEKVWDEILLADEKNKNTGADAPTLDPPEIKKKLFAIKPDADRQLKIAFVYDKEPASSVWIYGHELGRHDMETKFPGQLITKTMCGIDTNEKLAEGLHSLLEEKYDIIFTTGPEMLKESLKAAVEYPDAKILNCSLNLSTSHVRTYYARMYEAKFISGIIAGSLCKDGKLGYIADYPIFGTIANINAFALGASLVNPRARIYLTWEKVKDSNPKRYYRRHGVTYISGQEMATPELSTREFGLYHYKGGEIENLAMPLYNWGAFYERVVRNVLDGNYELEAKETKSKTLNYWWGMSSGIIDVICSDSHLPAGTMRLVRLVTKLIKSGELEPFAGKIVSQDGTIHSGADDKMSAEDIMQMKWLCSNVIGRVPRMDELVDEARDVVMMQGLQTAKNLELKMTTDVLKQPGV